MSGGVKTTLGVVGVILVIGLVVTGGMRIMERQETANQINTVREDLYRARTSADRCRNTLVNSESSLREFGLVIDDMRQRVEGYEIADGQVPAGEYQEYLELFDSYNDSVAVWETREERLRANEATCRQTIQDHNALSDSLQTLLDGAGIEAG